MWIFLLCKFSLINAGEKREIARLRRTAWLFCSMAAKPGHSPAGLLTLHWVGWIDILIWSGSKTELKMNTFWAWECLPSSNDMCISMCMRLQVLCPAVDKRDRLLDKVASTQESLLLALSLRHPCVQVIWGQAHRVMRRNGESQRESQVSKTAEAIETRWQGTFLCLLQSSSVNTA